MVTKIAKILVVDDDPNVGKLIHANLETDDYEVEIVYDGKEALAKTINCKDKLPDLIILDVMLPKMDGFEVARRIKTDGVCKSIPIIMLTAKDQPLDKIQGLINCEVEHYLTKSININDLNILIMKKLTPV